jgi:hypothetical protein
VRQLNLCYPDFAHDFAFMACFAQKVDRCNPNDVFGRVVIQQCRIAYRMYSSLLILVAEGFGLSAVIMGRSLFEYIVGLLYLVKYQSDPSVLADFMNYGVIALYESATMNSDQHVPSAFKEDYERVRAKFKPNDKWHRKSIWKLAVAVGLGSTYTTFYKVTSSVAHGDALAAMMQAGIRLNRPDPINDSFHGEIALETAFALMSTLYDKVLPCLRVATEDERILLRSIALKRACAFAGLSSTPDPNLVN